MVSLEFDNGWADAYAARDLLSGLNLHGTFFVMSGYPGAPGRLSVSQVQALAGDGNEIGGHTIDHPHLLTLTLDERAREICNDRVALLGDGLTVKSFACPYGQFDAATEAIASDCGYNSARGVGGTGCSGCRPLGRYPRWTGSPRERSKGSRHQPAWRRWRGTSRMRSSAAAGGADRLPPGVRRMQRALRRHTSDAPGLPRMVGPTVAVREWRRSTRSSAGRSTRPGASGCRWRRQPALESWSGTEWERGWVPDCWVPAGYGTNTYSWSRRTDAHTGGFGEQLVVSSWSSGDRKLIQPLNARGCAPTVRPGGTYEAGEWYRSTNPVRFVVYTRDATSGTWTFWKTSPFFASASGWAHAGWALPSIPSGVSAISLGLALSSASTATYDDAELIGTG